MNDTFLIKDSYEDILKELRDLGVIDKFEERLRKITGGTVYNQKAFDFLYATYKLNPLMFD